MGTSTPYLRVKRSSVVERTREGRNNKDTGLNNRIKSYVWSTVADVK